MEAEEITRSLTEAMGHLVRTEELPVEHQGDEDLAEHIGQLALELDGLLENR